MHFPGGSGLIDVPNILKMSRVEQGKKVADFGCGSSGYFVFEPAKQVGKYGLVYAVDILKPILENIKREAKQLNLQNVETVWSDLEVFNATRIESGSLDAGLLVNALYQSRKREAMVRETARMIKKGGVLTIVDWKNVAAPFGPPPERRVNKELLINIATKSGLKLEQEFSAGEYHYGLVFEKV